MLKNQRDKQRPWTAGLNLAVALFILLGLFLICLPGQAQEEEEEEFKGVGIHVKLRGASVTFSGGDIAKGSAGMYDQQVAEIASAGFELGENRTKPFRTGYELTGDIVYHFTPRIGIGVGGGLARAHQESSLLFHLPDSPNDYRLMSLPEIKILSLRLGLFYVIPLNRLVTICLSAGPEYHFADYKYGGNLTTPYSASSLTHRAKARQLGVQGSLGLEIRMNQRLAFVIEVLGRYAKISGFEGKEETYEWSGGQSSTVEDNGIILFIEGEQYPRLDIPSAGAPGGQDARKAVFDLSGVSLQAGLNFKF